MTWPSHLLEISSAQGSLYVAVLSASLLGSIHCAGMCGPFVAVYSAGDDGSGAKSGWGKVVPHVGYHGGRAATYLSLGALGGAAGTFVEFAGRAAGIAHVAAFVSGILVVFWGLSTAFPWLPFRSPVSRFFAPQLAKLGKRPRVFRASLLGVFTPLLPCGWLYAFVLTAAGTGSAQEGLLVMFVFWLGTVPALLGVGAVLAGVGQSLRSRVPVLTGVALIVVGSLGVVSRMAHPLATGATMGPHSKAESHPTGERPPCH